MSEDILDAIDKAVGDWAVSPDAMRWAPEGAVETPDPQRRVRRPGRVISGDWARLPGSTIDLQVPGWHEFMQIMFRGQQCAPDCALCLSEGSAEPT